MRVLLLAGASSTHTVRWANGLASLGVEVHLCSLHQASEKIDSSVAIHRLNGLPPWGYFTSVLSLRALRNRIQPDIVNAHYASGYGTLARISNMRPLLLSVWGSDVYDFPERGWIFRRLLRRNIEFADAIASTGHAMAMQTQRYAAPRRIFITPFGVDTDRFRPTEASPPSTALRIGTVKTLAEKYGVDTLIDGFAILYFRLSTSAPAIARRLRLVIVGDGPQRNELEKRARKLNIAGITRFVGKVSHDRVVDYLQELDVFAAISRLDSESFGVAILEASAAGLPVVVSDADGPKEVTANGVTGIVVPRDDSSATADALERLIKDDDLRSRMGANGRAHVIANYEWRSSLSTMLHAYEETIRTSY